MIIDYGYLYIKYNLDVSGIVHVGAHHGVEIDDYLRYKVEKVVGFEPIKSSFDVLKKHESEKVLLFNCALGETNKKDVKMNVASGDKCASSILTPKDCLIDHPTISFNNYELVDMYTLDSYDSYINDCNYLSIDVQGYEYEVLLGAEQTLKHMDYVYLEVNRGETYSGNKMIEEVDDLLSKYGIIRVETHWESRTWGDAFYMSEKKIKGNKNAL